MGRSERVTIPVPLGQRVAGRFRLLVVADTEILGTHPLPESGSITIGRDSDNNVVIDHDSISRRHAVLHIGRVITIEDKNSSNGTKVRDIAIPPHQPRELGINELVTLGSLTLIIQARFAPVLTNRIVTHDYFQARVEEECARAGRNDVQFAVIGIRVSEAPENVIVETLMSTLRQSDVFAKFDEGLYELLLLDTTLAQAEQVAQRLVTSLQLVGTASHVIAHFPTSGRSAYTLMTGIAGHTDELDGDLVIAERSMRDLYSLAKRLAASDLPVLILGETGVGKEKMSRAVHNYSPRSNKPFVAINCAALNDNLLESELFGHQRGSFTGAHSDKAGLFEAAAGGTVFLDEIGDMSLAIQAKLLRVIEDGEVRRVGAVKAHKTGARFVAATNADLESAIERGAFREDLYFRLSAATLVIPPLRERPRELDALVRRFASHAGTRTSGAPKQISSEALALLRGYSWPGNIRELRNVIERAVVLSSEGPITPEHLPVEKMRGTFVRPATNSEESPRERVKLTAVEERARVVEALERANGNQSQAASLLGVSRRTLINRLVQYDLPRPRKGRARDNDKTTGEG
ncbi:MAG TPA: sigma 54-interacting transcriptional regulator [Kofleriaceae bacterium]